jgi:UDP-N-acetylglucosamine--N-acetylmuramyl-(pentapeptide) pyrophosphoryl-undecaprenol N-acetylglucosamine transferase
MKLVITGGHHTSALPVIKYLMKTTPDTEIVWFGHKHSMRGNSNFTLEYRDITSFEIPFIDLPAGKFYKTYNPLRLAKIPLGFFVALYHLIKIRPDVILSFGGYLAVPTVLAGRLLGIPSVTHEQTVVTGYANKLIARVADKVLISHEESRPHFPEHKVVFSGLPLREELFSVKSSSFEFDNGLPVLYITAGKTGSHKINSVVLSCLPKLLEKFNVIHQCGDHSEYNDFDSLSRYCNSHNTSSSGGIYYLRKFVTGDEIGEVFHKADVFLSRAGAHTTYEIKVFGKPAIIIPIPWVSHNEQYLNAKILEDLGLGIILPEDELSPETLLTALNQSINRISQQDIVPSYDNSAVELICEEVLSLATNCGR